MWTDLAVLTILPEYVAVLSEHIFRWNVTEDNGVGIGLEYVLAEHKRVVVIISRKKAIKPFQFIATYNVLNLEVKPP